ncbi:MAG TPA: hypothetical protein VFZ91_12965 [Allosphingosinicella sp.]
MIRKLKSGQYRLYSRKVDEKTGKRRNLGTFATRADRLERTPRRPKALSQGGEPRSKEQVSCSTKPQRNGQRRTALNA